jgi:hypothetical protein
MTAVYAAARAASTEKATPNYFPRHSTRHGERPGHLRSASLAHAGVLSVWQVLQAFGTLSCVVADGGMNLKVCARTLTSASCVSIFGM